MVGTGVNNTGMGVVVARIFVGWGCVGGRKIVGVDRGVHAEAKIKTNSMTSGVGRRMKRSMSLLNHKVTCIK